MHQEKMRRPGGARRESKVQTVPDLLPNRGRRSAVRATVARTEQPDVAGGFMSSSLDRRPCRVVIVDDHPVVRMGLKQMLEGESDFEVCGEADGAAEALSVVAAASPDLVVVDISLKSGSGLDLVKQLAAKDRSIKVLVWSMHDESLFAERALRAGARGYINKEEAIDNMLAALRKVDSGAIYLSQTMTDRILQSIASGDLEEGRAPLEQLSDREMEVFELIGHGLTTRSAAEHLGLSVKTIETYRENIKTKLNLENNNELICRAAQWVAR
jgi:DNA-binding NarL/FixJ family response regulator